MGKNKITHLRAFNKLHLMQVTPGWGGGSQLQFMSFARKMEMIGWSIYSIGMEKLVKM